MTYSLGTGPSTSPPATERTAQWYKLSAPIAAWLRATHPHDFWVDARIADMRDGLVYIGMAPGTFFHRTRSGSSSVGGGDYQPMPGGDIKSIPYEQVMQALAPAASDGPTSKPGAFGKLPLYIGLTALGTVAALGAGLLLFRKKPAPAPAPARLAANRRRKSSRRMRSNPPVSLFRFQTVCNFGLDGGVYIRREDAWDMSHSGLIELEDGRVFECAEPLPGDWFKLLQVGTPAHDEWAAKRDASVLAQGERETPHSQHLDDWMLGRLRRNAGRTSRTAAPASLASNRRRTSLRRNAGAKKPVYCGVFFDESEMNVLRDWFRREAGLGLLPNIPKDPHLTSVFKPSLEAVSAMPLGSKVLLTVAGWAADEKGQALVVSGFPSANATPHLTLSTAQGVSPVYSNELLSQGFVSAQGPTVEGTVGYFDGAVQFSVPGGPAPLVSNASVKEIWWRCSRCGRSVHNHSKTRVTESRPKRCKKASGKTSTRCKFVRETSRGPSAGRTSKATVFKKLSLKNARTIAASIDRAAKRFGARHEEHPETKKDVRDLKRVATMLRAGRTEQAVKRGWSLDTFVRDQLPKRFYKIPSRAYPQV